jgi:outer membrane protein TolC
MKKQRFLNLILAAFSLAIVTTTAAGQTEAKPAKNPARLTLIEAIDLAFAQNPDLTAAEARIGQAEAKVAEVASGFYPQLTSRIGYDYSNNPALAFSYIVAQRRFNSADLSSINNPGFVSNFRPEVIGTINLYRGGQDDYLKQAAELGVKASELEHAALRNRLAAAVTSAYYAVISAPKQFEVAQKSVHTIAKEVDLTREKVAEGTALRGDVLSLEVREKASKESELQARNNITLSKAALKALLGEQQKELPEVIDVPADPLRVVPLRVHGHVVVGLAPFRVVPHVDATHLLHHGRRQPQTCSRHGYRHVDVRPHRWPAHRQDAQTGFKEAGT